MAVGTRGVVQVVLTTITVATAFSAFAFAYFFETYMNDLYGNMRGTPVTHGGKTYLPCVRAVLDKCSSNEHDQCETGCCPAGYECLIHPIVGLYCQDLQVVCGDRNWCMDFADILETCPTDTCANHKMTMRAVMWSYILSAVGVFLDLTDIIAFFRCPDNIVAKSTINLVSSLMKWTAFGAVLGAGVPSFIADLEKASCFNKDGVQLVGESTGVFVLFAIVQVASAILSLTLAPFSAYWGGKLVGVPYAK